MRLACTLSALIVGGSCVSSFAPTSRGRGLGSLRMQQHEKIVVTGLGVVSAVGSTPDIFFDSLCKGASGITSVTRFDPSPFKCQIAAQINDFDPKTYYKSKKKIKQNDLCCHFAVAGAHLALADAGISLGAEGNTVDPTRVGVIIGSAFGGSIYEMINDFHLRMLSVGPNQMNTIQILYLQHAGMDSFERAANDLTKYGPGAVGPYTIPMILGNTAAVG